MRLRSFGRVPEAGNWTIVELQGELETREEVSLEGRAIGDLHFDNKVRSTWRYVIESPNICEEIDKKSDGVLNQC